MAVYADKKNGKLNGRWRVELQKGKQRYRARHDNHADAEADDARVKALWEAGEVPSGTVSALKVHTHHSIASVSQEASGVLWRGLAGEASAWAHIRIIGEIIGPEKPIDEIDTLVVDKIVAELIKRGKALPTVNRYLSHLHTFLKWASRRKLLKTPLADITFDWQKESLGRIRWVTPAEEAQLQQLLPDEVWKFVKVGLETGCRLSELLTVEPTQIVGDLLHLWVTKTDNPRTIPMAPEIREMLQELVEQGTMPSKYWVRKHWTLAKAAMGLADDKQFVFHVCRHTCSTRLMDAEVHPFVAQAWMGHKRIETTKRYTHVKPSNLEEALVRRGNHQERLTASSQKAAK